MTKVITYHTVKQLPMTTVITYYAVKQSHMASHYLACREAVTYDYSYYLPHS
jgi:hypothetical protein